MGDDVAELAALVVGPEIAVAGLEDVEALRPRGDQQAHLDAGTGGLVVIGRLGPQLDLFHLPAAVQQHEAAIDEIHHIRVLGQGRRVHQDGSAVTQQQRFRQRFDGSVARAEDVGAAQLVDRRIDRLLRPLGVVDAAPLDVDLQGDQPGKAGVACQNVLEDGFIAVARGQ
ncbi:hypothetical protein WV31_01685 [Magnetospirillum sp. ME-1]|uniref:hypothetical protein n=1 Tax=Magnetospirillum sp. ME-1 TaxID=1639348 RepID=UPI000A17D3E9|nr:hypothetical protein [Magnetospirillum sp. ME-1]ARJ64493.1 hypothetical protein WV31_01685 [Magnetospirillum sp. ME-1]